MNELAPKVTTEDMLKTRIKHLEGALELAMGVFSDVQRKGNLYKWCHATLRDKVNPKVVDVVTAQDPTMLTTTQP